MGLESEDEDEDGEDNDDVKGGAKKSDEEEEETLQTNIDDLDQFRLPKAEESEKEGE